MEFLNREILADSVQILAGPFSITNPELSNAEGAPRLMKSGPVSENSSHMRSI
jgi:hypothetical protein